MRHAHDASAFCGMEAAINRSFRLSSVPGPESSDGPQRRTPSVAVVDILRIPSLYGRAPRRSWLARVRARRDADRWLRVSEGRWESHPAFAWRTAELTSSRERRVLARSLHGIVSDVRAPRSTFSASPLNRRGLVPYLREIEETADLVSDLEQPVTAAGIVLVRDLLTDGGSPLYFGGNVDDLPKTLSRIRSTLEAH
jgi:hypothetical protein